MGELREAPLMPRQAEPRWVGCRSGVQGLAVEKRQAPAGQAIRFGMRTAVPGVEETPNPVAARVCGTR